MFEPGQGIPLRDASGRDAGTFTLQGLLARGGQGFVYTLRSPQGRLAVLKVPSPAGLVGAEIERKILLQLPPHRNVVRVLGVTELQGVLCPVFAFAWPNPFVRLGTREVKDALARQSWTPALPASTAIEMVQEVCAALEHLHQHGYVHGDIKPANVLVELDANRVHLPNKEYFAAIQRRAYTTVLVDFGSTRGAQYLASKSDRDEEVVPSEFTPVFAPPEMYLPGGKVGATIDAYQVGLLLYQLISGRTPYDHHLTKQQLGGLTKELLELKRAEAKGTLRAFDVDALRANPHEDVFFSETYQSQARRGRFYEDVARVIDLATSPDPRSRPGMAELRAEITRLFELEPLAAPGSGRVRMAVGNPRWHLRRTNRLAAAARATDAPEVAVEGELMVVSHSATTRPPPAGSGASPRAQLELPARANQPPPRITRLLQRREVADPRDAVAAPPAAGEGGVPISPLTGLRVALVDDDKLALAMIGSILRRRGALVATFRDPEVALETVARDHPDALICDLQMPGLSGLGLIRALAERLSGLPFPAIVFSSIEKEAALQDAFRAGACDYLVKPVAEAELVAKLERHVTLLSSKQPAVPADLGGFELLDEVRRGELGLVFRAAEPWDESEPSHMVKVLRPSLVGRAGPLLRLEREIDVLARCDHPAIPRLVRSGLVDGLLYYVTGLLPLRTLGQEVREDGTLDEDGVASILLDAGGALEHLHAQGLVLGDLTPESMGRLETGRVLVTELSAARWCGAARREEEPPFPKTRYAGPELFEDPPRPGQALDLYALGASVLEAWSGRPAVRARGTGRIDASELGRGLPAEVVRLLQDLVDPDPRGRPTSEQLLAELARLV